MKAIWNNTVIAESGDTVVTAAALGAVAATSAYNDHTMYGELCTLHAVPASTVELP